MLYYHKFAVKMNKERKIIIKYNNDYKEPI